MGYKSQGGKSTLRCLLIFLVWISDQVEHCSQASYHILFSQGDPALTHLKLLLELQRSSEELTRDRVPLITESESFPQRTDKPLCCLLRCRAKKKWTGNATLQGSGRASSCLPESEPCVYKAGLAENRLVLPTLICP